MLVSFSEILYTHTTWKLKYLYRIGFPAIILIHESSFSYIYGNIILQCKRTSYVESSMLLPLEFRQSTDGGQYEGRPKESWCGPE